ncbi:MAG: SsrA-binding protein [Deltaproteobacteria bacterium]
MLGPKWRCERSTSQEKGGSEANRGNEALIESSYLNRNIACLAPEVYISPYPQANRMNHEPLRTRKLLLHKREIRRLIGKIEQRGYTLIPLKFYFANGKVKVDLGLAKGKKLFDKRETVKKKTMEREMERGRKGFDGDR